MMKNGRAGHSGLTERPILNELSIDRDASTRFRNKWGKKSSP
jgi:hypothetical protein